MMPVDEDRRSQVMLLLSECVDKKLVRGDGAEALKKAQEAYRLANESPKLPAPWPQLAAYRLAHLRMRDQSLALQALKEIDGLFKEAAEQSSLEVAPLVYRLAVLSRMRQLEKDRQRSTLTKTIDEVLQQARNVVHGISYRELPQNSRLVLQSSAFNLVELATFFLDGPYAELEGLGCHDPLVTGGAKSWFVWSRGSEIIHMTKGMAECEFKARSSTGKHVLIELGPTQDRWQWSVDGHGEWQDANWAPLSYLMAHLTDLKFCAANSKKSNQATQPIKQATLRQHKSRVIEDLQNLTGKPKLRVFEENGTLTNEISYLALIQTQRLARELRH